ncbi:carboxymuconolactone decarboxylase family protein [Subtercola frigoramans]|uniref:4-carboxymuconolactone decarboxylase n=1 Tax=Subtercola frigoramans TaxID=120298 RepID=A0ABS2L0R2_9MICO|nr:carboxymuconolactone decarboxylase family protein [Subtercola frigoramans]MBM7470652.1 4-carboxymuconolactone decarboxylase [Subtercola frigoramans]
MRLPRLTPDELDSDQAELYSEIVGGPRSKGPQHFPLSARDGTLNGPFNAFLYAPALSRPLQALGAAIRFETTLTARERETAILIVAARWNSAFERASHEAVGRAAGLTADEMLDVQSGRVPTLIDAHEQAVATATFAIAHGDLDDTGWAAASAYLQAHELVELTTLVGYYAALALQLRVFRVDPAPTTSSA